MLAGWGGGSSLLDEAASAAADHRCNVYHLAFTESQWNYFISSFYGTQCLTMPHSTSASQCSLDPVYKLVLGLHNLQELLCACLSSVYQLYNFEGYLHVCSDTAKKFLGPLHSVCPHGMFSDMHLQFRHFSKAWLTHSGNAGSWAAIPLLRAGETPDFGSVFPAPSWQRNHAPRQLHHRKFQHYSFQELVFIEREVKTERDRDQL